MSETAPVLVQRLSNAAELDVLRPLWLALHHHHRDVQAATPLQPDDEVSWRARSETYRRWLEDGDALVLTATVDREVAGYLVAHLLSGTDDDTFDYGARYAELYTVSVLPGRRGHRIGSHLLDALDDALRADSIKTVTVAAMAGNTRAIEFYRRRGFQPVEVNFMRKVPASPEQGDETD
jgi:ribosomal protein S18 acetylase RimI-like enzyme